MRCFLLDSSVLLRLARGGSDALAGRVTELLQEPEAPVLATSSLNVFEIARARGHSSAFDARVTELLNSLVIFAVSASTATRAAALQGALGRDSRQPAMELLLLAVAQENNATLVTDDVALLTLARASGVHAITSPEL